MAAVTAASAAATAAAAAVAAIAQPIVLATPADSASADVSSNFAEPNAAPADTIPEQSASVEHSPHPKTESSSDLPAYEVNIRCIDGTTTQLEVPNDLRISDVKEIIADLLDVPADTQRLIFRGHVVTDDDTVGKHITENNQTIHMVQRPGHRGDDQTQRGEQAADASNVRGMSPQVHFQFSTADSGGGMDLSQLLNTVLGAAGRGGGMGTVVHTATSQLPGRPVPVPVGSAAFGTAPGGFGIAGSQDPARSSSRLAGPTDVDLGRPGRNASDGAVAASTGPSGPRSGLPSRPPLPQAAGIVPGGGHLNAHFANMAQGASGNESGGVGSAAGGSAVALTPFQIVFQQGLGNLAHILPSVMGDASVPEVGGVNRPAGNTAGHQSGDTLGSNESSQGRVGSNVRSGSGGGNNSGGVTLPWREMRRFSLHLNRLLGRVSQHRMLPPAHMPTGELNAFLACLHASTSQLGVAIGDMQASLNDGSGLQARQRLQFAMALVAAARTLRGAATALQSGFGESEVVGTLSATATGPQSSALAASVDASGGAADAPRQPAHTDVPSVSDTVGAERLEGGVTNASSDSDGDCRRTLVSDSSHGHAEAVGENSAASGAAAPEVVQDSVSIAEVSGSGWQPWPVEGDLEEIGEDFSEPAPLVMDATVSRNVTELERLVGSDAAAGKDCDSEGSGKASDDASSAQIVADSFNGCSPAVPMLPPANVAAPFALSTTLPTTGSVLSTTDDVSHYVDVCWQHWTQQDSFRRVVEQARQVPFSTAYLSGDATNSQFSQVTIPLPVPGDMLSLPWYRAADRTDEELPDMPDHLSRAYLSAFLRDLGRSLGVDSNFRSIPSAEARFPRLHQLASFVSQSSQGSVDQHSSSAPPTDGIDTTS
eukprot:TRINITY_DN75826_c0_g1_i1.p1 TRINITY_DN75826_c0_g1~~TRINITY_DN75826_c0_g1_i1.p1  ORF type:complete len:990 (+),score=185.52 TRINITY_DN75826_c0_g1_i1:326-2971(+)